LLSVISRGILSGDEVSSSGHSFGQEMAQAAEKRDSIGFPENVIDF